MGYFQAVKVLEDADSAQALINKLVDTHLYPKSWPYIELMAKSFKKYKAGNHPLALAEYFKFHDKAVENTRRTVLADFHAKALPAAFKKLSGSELLSPNNELGLNTDSEVGRMLRTDATVRFGKLLDKADFWNVATQDKVDVVNEYDKSAYSFSSEFNSKRKSHLEDYSNQLHEQYPDDMSRVFEEFKAERARVESDQFTTEEHRIEKERLDSLREQASKVKSEIGQAFLDVVLDTSVVSEEEALEWAKNQVIDPRFIKRVKKLYSQDELLNDLAEFYRLTNGRLAAVNIAMEEQDSGRSFAKPEAKKIFLSKENMKTKAKAKSVLFHELAHLLEGDQEVKLATRDFLRGRYKAHGERILPLSDIDPDRNYGKNEMAIDAKLYNSYLGKVYADGLTEVMSMIIQEFSDPERLGNFYLRDPEVYELVAGLLAQVSSKTDNERKLELDRVKLNAEYVARVDALAKEIPDDLEVVYEGRKSKRYAYGDIAELYYETRDTVLVFNKRLFKVDEAKKVRDVRVLRLLYTLLYSRSIGKLSETGNEYYHDAVRGIAPEWYEQGMNLPHPSELKQGS